MGGGGVGTIIRNLRVACIFGHWRRPGVWSASVGLLKKLGPDNRYDILLQKQQDPHRSMTFFVDLKQKYHLFHHIFFIFFQSTKRILLFLQLDETPDAVLGVRYRNRLFLSQKKQSVFHWNVGWFSLELLKDLTRIKIEFLQ